MIGQAFVAAVMAASAAFSMPLVDRATSGDAPYSVPSANLTSAIECPRGVQGRAGGIVLLVHGTGSTGEESWGAGPYNSLLPDIDPGYDICWVTFPGRSQGDSQVTAEYVSYNIPRLANQSATGKVALVAHSQGNLNVQWALNFWPSSRKYVSAYTALSGDFNGTIEGTFACALSDLLAGGCTPATIQQTTGSNFLKALRVKGSNELVPTTSLFTRYDEVIQNEQDPDPTSIVGGAANFALQDNDICGFLHPAEHFSMVIDPAAFKLAVDAIQHGGHASAARFDRKSCLDFGHGTGFDNNTFAKVAQELKSIVLDVASFGLENKTKTEPPLLQYVCDQGSATKCGPAKGA